MLISLLQPFHPKVVESRSGGGSAAKSLPEERADSAAEAFRKEQKTQVAACSPRRVTPPGERARSPRTLLELRDQDERRRTRKEVRTSITMKSSSKLFPRGQCQRALPRRRAISLQRGHDDYGAEEEDVPEGPATRPRRPLLAISVRCKFFCCSEAGVPSKVRGFGRD